MNKLQKIILLTLVSTSALAWVMSKDQPDMMKAMMTYDSIAIALFTVSWTIGMAAMMFPAISPMVLLYNRLIKNDNSDSISNGKDKQVLSSTSIVIEGKNDNANLDDEDVDKRTSSYYFFKMILFVGSYLTVWALTGLVLLLAWSVPMNSFVIMGIERKQLDIIYGVLLIIAGAYQFSPLKTVCIGYCESPLSFFMRRWRSGTIGALKMGTYHGLYCLGCCWPYFLLMIALGWMNLLWMGLFAGIIFAEKIWSKGIYIAKITGIIFIVIGLISALGMISIDNFSESTSMNEGQMSDNKMESQIRDSSDHNSMRHMAMNMNTK